MRPILAALSGEKRAPSRKGSRRSTEAAAGGRGRARGPFPRRSTTARLSGSAPGLPARLFFGTARRDQSFPGSKKLFLVSHLYFDSAGGKTAFLVSQETVLHVGLTSRRGDVTTHATRQRGSRTPLRRPEPSC